MRTFSSARAPQVAVQLTSRTNAARQANPLRIQRTSWNIQNPIGKNTIYGSGQGSVRMPQTVSPFSFRAVKQDTQALWAPSRARVNLPL